MTDEKLKRVRLWQKETHKLIDVEPIKLISQICKCCGGIYLRQAVEEDWGVCDSCLSKTIVEFYKEENNDLTIK